MKQKVRKSSEYSHLGKNIMNKKKVYFFIGTTAELIKLIPIIKELNRRKISFKLITSGQVTINFSEFTGFTKNIKSDITFRQKRGDKSSVAFFVIWAIQTFFTALASLKKEFHGLNKNNSYFIIHGDTVSSTIGAIIAKFYGLKLVHIESGYLSFNLFEPFPEEICRSINIRLADILFSPTDWAKNNIKNLRAKKVSTGQNTMIETFWWAMKQKLISKEVTKYKKYFILIMHRQEHVLFRKDWSKKILQFIINNAKKDLTCLLVGYPLTVEIIKSLNLNLKSSKIMVIPPLPYRDFIKLMDRSEFIASDGCTNQQETFYMGKPFLSLRDLLDQSEGVGKNLVLCKSDFKMMKEFLTNYKKYKTKKVHFSTRPSKIVVDTLFAA